MLWAFEGNAQVVRQTSLFRRSRPSFPFKGKAGMGMGFSVPAHTTVMSGARYPTKPGHDSYGRIPWRSSEYPFSPVSSEVGHVFTRHAASPFVGVLPTAVNPYIFQARCPETLRPLQGEGRDTSVYKEPNGHAFSGLAPRRCLAARAFVEQVAARDLVRGTSGLEAEWRRFA